MNVLIRGGGDLGSGIAYRLFTIGWNVVITETEQPFVLRRSVAFANAIYESSMQVEGITAHKIQTSQQISGLLQKRLIPVLISPNQYIFSEFKPDVVVDARMLKKFVDYKLSNAPIIIGLGPGFIVEKNCHAVVETHRGHYLGRAIYSGQAIADTGMPGRVASISGERVIRAPADGVIQSDANLGDLFSEGEIIGYVGNEPFKAPFDGCLRGLMHNGIQVEKGLKIGDLDPRKDPEMINYISDKSLAVAGGVLEAILHLTQE